MSDLLITINMNSFKKNKILILETYYTAKVETNKSGRFRGGSITPANLSYAKPVGNCDIEDVCDLLNKYCYRLSNNGYYISIESLKKIVNSSSKKIMLFLDNTDKSLVLVDSIIEVKPKRKAKNSYKANNITIEWYLNCALYIKEEEHIFKHTMCEPVSILQYAVKENAYYLYFYYGDEAVGYADRKYTVQSDDNLYLRNNEFETYVYHILLEENFTKISGCKFIYLGKKNQVDLKDSLLMKNIFIDLARFTWDRKISNCVVETQLFQH